MLVYFKMGNFKSIKDPVIINFNAASISEHSESNKLNEGGIDLIRSILLYGHNASGKSKILDALDFFRIWITHSVEESIVEIVRPEPFALSATTEKEPSHFEACFILNNTIYRYGIKVDREKVHSEWLLESKSATGKDYPIFLRGDNEFQVDYKRFENAEGLDTKTRPNALFLTVASQWNVKVAIDIVRWFRNIQFIHGIREQLYAEKTIEFLKDPMYASLIKELINKADLGISDVGLTEAEDAPDTFRTDLFGQVIKTTRKTRPNVYTVHTKYDETNNPIAEVQFSLKRQESEGTIKYFNIIGQLLYAIQNGYLVVIDEFDAQIHTLLSKAIIKLFNTGQSKSKSQLFITSHDTALLDRKLLRRDQIYFVAKNKFGASEVTSLVEYKTRKESPYDKNYLEGKYGAIPFIEEFESLLKDAQ
jgi:uncharacterized protein